jgi:guanylate kinase
MEILFCFIGPSGSGKSTLEATMCKLYPQSFFKVVSLTTRPKRDGEVSGKDYHFLTHAQFNQLESNGKLFQKTDFAGNRYGSTKGEYQRPAKYGILVIEPSSFLAFRAAFEKDFPDKKLRVVFFDVSEACVYSNMRKRGDSEEAIIKRMNSDNIREDFESLRVIADYDIKDDDINNDLPGLFLRLVNNFENKVADSTCECGHEWDHRGVCKNV